MSPSNHDLTRQLQALPDFDPPAGGWDTLRRQLDAAPGRRRRRRLGAWALAASLLASVGIGWQLWPQAQPDRADTELSQLIAQSQRLERTLQRVRPQAVVWDARLAARAEGLENDLAVVDLQLNYAQDAARRRLWRDRVALMSQLVQTHQGAALQAEPRIQELSI